MNPQINFLLNKSLEFLRNTNLDSAKIYLMQALRLQADNPHVLRLLGVIAAQRRQYSDALKYFNDSLKANPKNSLTLSNIGNVFLELKQYDNALDAYDRSLKIDQKYEEVWSNKGNVLSELKRYDEAIAHYDKAISLRIDFAEGWANKGNVLNKLKKYDEAIAHYDKALSLKSDHVEAWVNKGVTLHKLKKYDEAIAHYDKALSLKSDHVEAWVNKGVTLHKLKKYDEAIAHYDKALSLKSDHVEAWVNKGLVLYGIARRLDARICFDKALACNPALSKARWAKLFTSIPVILHGEENLKELRGEFLFGLDQLDKWFLGKNLDEAHELIGLAQPFYLAYQEQNNKDILNKYGQLCRRLLNNWQNSNEFLSSAKGGIGKIRVGIVSEQIRNHSVWNAITKGLVFNLDASKFEIHIFHLGSTVDEETSSAKIKATTFTDNQGSLLGWIKTILEKSIDVLLYPEIGMDPLTTQLACLRLAPIQAACWGHPQTTGLPTVDFYLSAELFEDESSQDAYTETLVKLPNLGCNYSRLPIVATKVDFESLGISSNYPILICPGAPFKYFPQYDAIFVDIAKRLGKCKLIFFIHENISLSKIFRERLEGVFDQSNLDLVDYVVFIPWLNSEDFYGLMKCADVYLDTIGFSGFNTAMQAIDCALPIITMEGVHMRGRFASGILKRMEMYELIASNADSYVGLVVRLVQDNLYRNHIVEKINERRDILYDDRQPIIAFEQFLITHSARNSVPIPILDNE